MGSFIGHAIPGVFFFVYGIWWVTQVMRRHFLCRQTRQRFRTSANFPFPYCPGERMRNFPVEPVIKMVLCGAGIIVEIIGGINPVNHRFESVGNAQHITMYFFFALSGVIDLMTMKGLAPAGSEYIGLMIALLVEGALFKFHLFGRSHLDIIIHTLLLYVIGMGALVVALEAAFRNTAVLPLLRSLLAMLQGTWFCGVGIILYNPFPGAQPWDPEDHHSLMLAVVCFTWHVLANIVIILIVGGVTACCYRRRVHYSKLSGMPLKGLGAHGGVGVGAEAALSGVRGYRDDDDDDVEVGEGRDIDDSDVEFHAPVRK